jgi:hypothetical protein
MVLSRPTRITFDSENDKESVTIADSLSFEKR